MQARIGIGHGRLGLVAFVVLTSAVLMACVPEETKVAVDEVNYWEQRKGQCETILASPHAYEAPDVIKCMKIWETYQTVGDLSVDVRSMYAVAFSLAWYKAEDDYTKAIADAALARLCIPKHPIGSDGKIAEKVPNGLQCGSAAQFADAEAKAGTGTDTAAAAPQVDNSLVDLRGSIQVKDVSEKRQKKAQGFNKKALRAHNKKQYGAALDLYDQALDTYPHYVLAQDNKACAPALRGADEGSISAI